MAYQAVVCVPTARISILNEIPANLLAVLLPNSTAKTREDGPRAWAPSPQWETRTEFLDPGFSLAQARLLPLRMNQYMQDSFLCISFLILSFKEIINL